MSLPDYTEEQYEVIASEGNCRVNAVAGSGKTTTLLGYAAARPKERILFLSFNRSNAQDAKAKFSQQCLRHVRVETIHSLAFKGLGVGRGKYRLTDSGSLSTQDVVKLCGLLPGIFGGVDHLVTAKHILSLLSLYCHSDLQRLQEIDYLSSIKEDEAKESAKGILEEIYRYVHELLTRMYRGEIPLTHDVYLKFYQLGSPSLPYSTILLDEGQDCDPVTLALLRSQERACKAVVGDTHQSIYSFRHAINFLEQLDFQQFDLTHSFRFPQDIAQTAMEALRLKRHIKGSPPPQIVGKGLPSGSGSTRAILARTNLTLMNQAIDLLTRERDCRIFFEGNLSNYTFMSEGSIYDILFLSLSQKDKIKSRLIRQFGSLDELGEYISATGDQELAIGLGMVKQNGAELFTLLREIKEKQAVSKQDADVVMSTLHRAKGSEYDVVDLVGSGFISESDILENLSQARKKSMVPDFQGLSEEINALYVGITRARQKVNHGFWVGDVPPNIKV